MVGENRVELSPRVSRTRMLALHHTPGRNFELRTSDCEFEAGPISLTEAKERITMRPIQQTTNERKGKETACLPLQDLFQEISPSIRQCRSPTNPTTR